MARPLTAGALLLSRSIMSSAKQTIENTESLHEIKRLEEIIHEYEHEIHEYEHELDLAHNFLSRQLRVSG